MKRQVLAVLIACVLGVLSAHAGAWAGNTLGTEANPIRVFVPLHVDPEYASSAAVDIAEVISAATGLFIVGEPVSPLTIPDKLASAPGEAFGILDAGDYVKTYELTGGAITPRLSGLKSGYDYTFSSIYVRREDGYRFVSDLAGAQWVHSRQSATSEGVPRTVFDEMELSLTEAVVGWEAAALVALLTNEEISFATGYGAPPLPPTGWAGPEWVLGDDSERWIWDEDFLSLYPVDVRGACRDLREATSRPLWLQDGELLEALTLDRILSEIGVLATFGPIPNECVAFAEGFPEELADRITVAIADHVRSNEGSEMWGDRRFLGWTDTQAIDDSYYDSYRERIGATPFEAASGEAASGDSGQLEDASDGAAPASVETESTSPAVDGSPVAKLQTPGGTVDVRAVAMCEFHAYLLTREGRLYVFDLEDVGPDGITGVLDTPIKRVSTGLGRGIVCNGTALYVYGSSGFAVYDISEPANPRRVDSLGGFSIYNIDIGEGVLVAAGQGGIRTYGFPIGDPTQLTPLGSLSLDSEARVYAVGILPGDIVLSSEYAPSTTAGGSDVVYTLRILDISNPEAPVEVAAEAADFLAYHIFPWSGGRVVVCTSDDVRLARLTEDVQLTTLDVERVPQPHNAGGGARTAAQVGDYLITNGAIFQAAGDLLEVAGTFEPECICSDGYPYPGATGTAHAAIARSCSVAVFSLSVPEEP